LGFIAWTKVRDIATPAGLVGLTLDHDRTGQELGPLQNPL
jgi:hypothetical protein